MISRPSGVSQGDVAPDIEPEPDVGRFGAARPARVDRVQAGAVADAAQEVMKKIGCVSRALLPQRTMRSVSSASRYELVPPPAPKTVARPATLGACQVRLQLSMLLLPSTARENFCAAKLTSLVAFEQQKTPKVVGPWALSLP